MPRDIQHCSACRAREHTRPNCPIVYTCKPPPRVSAQLSETYALREAVWEQLSFRFPVPAMTLFERIVDDWGDIGERRLWRALKWNLQRKRIERRIIDTDNGQMSGYVRRAA